MDAVFIRAPRFRALFPDVEVLARYAGEPVLVRQGRVVACTFHPELTPSRGLHRYLAGLARTGRRGQARLAPGRGPGPSPDAALVT
jgi:pyridoxal 5'-phosphate synthase pdxT subunit